ncbi:4'-phosphopantetheinyl transferase family protein [Engelhardtia mirabilis]|uniref:4'-phosphopantetheinyl transferase sfp n=1 Tax=Engelhardtia mirabilis TaxID=2528011 RepID=A0A518BLK2_9BACT|nr:4'-phosphopantetheinyl transferase sfp [Planctomycetes bacterium Pla133]QDV02178.1 4'-phosphopantetheinyl transferase sfp [Planctomycetes bacterium Pla86]
MNDLPEGNPARLERAVEVWLGSPEALGGLAGRDLLDDAERARADRFLRPEPQVTYTSAHALVRRALSAYAPVEPRQWRFSVGEHGRPDVDPRTPGLDADTRRLAFNLSHTRGLVAVAVSTVPAIGVDVEWIGRKNDLRRLAAAKFAPAERGRLEREVDEQAFRRRFFRYWTLKESYLKARGTGITLPLDAFAFQVECGAPVDVAFDAVLGDDPSAWQFEVSDVGTEHALAVAVGRGVDAPDLAVRIFTAGVGRP